MDTEIIRYINQDFNLKRDLPFENDLDEDDDLLIQHLNQPNPFPDTSFAALSDVSGIEGYRFKFIGREHK